MNPPAETPAEAEDCLDRAQAFVRAVAWGEHTTIWKLLSDSGRALALSVATRNGMDRTAAARIRGGVADPAERDEFLRRLVEGLQRDLRSVDLATLTASSARLAPADRADSAEATSEVQLVCESIIPNTDHWPAGTLTMSRHSVRGWTVDRLNPITVQP